MMKTAEALCAPISQEIETIKNSNICISREGNQTRLIFNNTYNFVSSSLPCLTAKMGIHQSWRRLYPLSTCPGLTHIGLALNSYYATHHCIKW